MNFTALDRQRILADVLRGTLPAHNGAPVIDFAALGSRRALPRAVAAWDAARPEREARETAQGLAAATTPTADALAAIERVARAAMDMPADDPADVAPAPEPPAGEPGKE